MDYELGVKRIGDRNTICKNTRTVWEDLREWFDKVNTSRVYQLHRRLQQSLKELIVFQFISQNFEISGTNLTV